jgi:hypothetical protein
MTERVGIEAFGQRLICERPEFDAGHCDLSFLENGAAAR